MVSQLAQSHYSDPYEIEKKQSRAAINYQSGLNLLCSVEELWQLARQCRLAMQAVQSSSDLPFISLHMPPFSRY